MEHMCKTGSMCITDACVVFQGLGSEASHLPEDSLLRPLWPPGLLMGGAKETGVLEAQTAQTGIINKAQNGEHRRRFYVATRVIVR